MHTEKQPPRLSRSALKVSLGGVDGGLVGGPTKYFVTPYSSEVDLAVTTNFLTGKEIRPIYSCEDIDSQPKSKISTFANVILCNMLHNMLFNMLHSMMLNILHGLNLLQIFLTKLLTRLPGAVPQPLF